MHSQFKQGVVIAWGNAIHKLARLHYLSATKTKESAAYTAKTNNSQHRCIPNQTGQSSWCAEHTSPEYEIYEQFRNGYEYSMP